MSDANQYGQYYYCVKVSKDLSKQGEIYVRADEVKTHPDGAVAFISKREAKQNFTNLLIPSGKWNAVYAASVIDGHAVAIEHWTEEVIPV